MTKLSALEPILNGNPADAILVNDNFTDISTHVNGELINRDGSVAMQDPLVLSAVAPSDPLHAVRLADLGPGGGLGFPAGVILDYVGTVAPVGSWLLCDGQLYDGAPTGEFASLFAVIGTAFNTGGEGPTQFRVPDFTANGGRGSVGPGASTGNVGSTGGSADTIVAQHSHPVPEHGHGNDFGVSNKVKFNTEEAKDDHTHKWSYTIKDNVTRRSSGAPIGDTSSALRVMVSNNNQVVENGRMSSNSTVWTPMAATPSGQGNYIPAISTRLSIDWGDNALSGSTTTVAGAGGQDGFGHAHEVPEHGHSLTGGVKDKPGFNTNSTGGSGTDTNYQPYITVTKIIRY
jgi:microcystin-dependent protein